MICPNCNHQIIYTLSTGQKKCAKCKKKFSEKKIKMKKQIVKCFCDDKTVNSTCKELGINYLTVKKQYISIREIIALYLEKEYEKKEVIEYDEYIYLEQSKKKIAKNIFDAHNFLTFHYENKVYNLLMPNLQQYKNEFISDKIDEAYFKEFSKFMMLNKIAKLQKRENIIILFWEYFEKSILKYKGIEKNNFFYYLKEIEFKFNYTKSEQLSILEEIL